MTNPILTAKKQILWITQNYPPQKGGMSASCHRIVKNLRKEGIKVHVLVFSNRKKMGYTESIPQEGGMRYQVRIMQTEEQTLNLAQLLIDHEVENISEINDVVAFGGYLPMLFAPILAQFINKPFHLCLRGNDFDEMIFSKKRPVLQYALEKSKNVFCVSKDMQHKVKSLVDMRTQVIYSPNGIAADKWALKESDKHQNINPALASDKTTILIAGQLKHKKGILLFAQELEKSPFKDTFQICLVGDLSEVLKEELNQMQIDFIFIPFLNAEALRSYYTIADIVALPSLYDGMPNVLLEAGAMGKTILATEVGGIKDVIEHKKDGILYKPLEKNALIDALLYYLKTPKEEIESLGRNLSEKIQENYNEKQEVMNYFNTFNT